MLTTIKTNKQNEKKTSANKQLKPLSVEVIIIAQRRLQHTDQNITIYMESDYIIKQNKKKPTKKQFSSLIFGSVFITITTCKLIVIVFPFVVSSKIDGLITTCSSWKALFHFHSPISHVLRARKVSLSVGENILEKKGIKLIKKILVQFDYFCEKKTLRHEYKKFHRCFYSWFDWC